MRLAVCRALICALLFQVIAPVAYAQTTERTATTTTTAPVFGTADSSKEPLRVATAGSVLLLLAEQGEWCQVEFQDPEFGRRTGYVQTKLLTLTPTSNRGDRGSQPPVDLTTSDRRAPATPRSAGSAGRVGAVETTSTGVRDGELLGNGIHTGGKVGVGVALGIFTGLLGTGIGYFVIGPESLSPEAFQQSSSRGPEYQMGFKSGWEKKTESKKRHAFLAGGLLGTAAWVLLLVSAQSGN